MYLYENRDFSSFGSDKYFLINNESSVKGSMCAPWNFMRFVQYY